MAALAAFGGFEIATMVGAVLQAAAQRRVIVVDGFIASAAVLVARELAPTLTQRCVFSHRSGEQGHALMLAALGSQPGVSAQPLLDLGLRLGEGSGAALAWPLLAPSVPPRPTADWYATRCNWVSRKPPLAAARFCCIFAGRRH